MRIEKRRLVGFSVPPHRLIQKGDFGACRYGVKILKLSHMKVYVNLICGYVERHESPAV